MPRTITLNNGRILPVRSLQPEDAALLQTFHRSHSARTLYQRFFGHYPELSDAMAERFATVDGHDRLALVATDPENDGKFVGVVRLDRDPGTHSAEYAAVVTDNWQGLGVGHGLTVHLLDDAVREGIFHVYALVLAGNQPMLALLKGLGLPWRSSMGSGFERVEIELDETWGEKP
ncbi:MAG: GNAT family N-acetyltransferase [Thermomicrobiales bacterium]